MVNWYEAEDFDRVVFFVNDDLEIESETFGTLCRKYADETTTPHGVAPRYHTRGKELWSWGAGGNNPYKVEAFDTEEEAEHALMLSFMHDFANANDAPNVFNTREEADQDLEEIVADLADNE